MSDARLAEITHLSKGKHISIDSGACLLEAVSYVAGESWSDHPDCVCPVIARFFRQWNDDLPDDDRDRLLLPLIPRLIGTRADEQTETRREMMALDWLIRTYTPAWLRLAGLGDHADALAGLPEIVSTPVGDSVLAATNASWNASWAASRAASRAASDAASRAASDAASDAASRAASRAASWYAGVAASGAASWAASGGAAGAAVGAAVGAGHDLAPTITALQTSALDLAGRMIKA